MREDALIRETWFPLKLKLMEMDGVTAVHVLVPAHQAPLFFRREDGELERVENPHAEGVIFGLGFTKEEVAQMLALFPAQEDQA